MYIDNILASNACNRTINMTRQYNVNFNIWKLGIYLISKNNNEQSACVHVTEFHNIILNMLQ